MKILSFVIALLFSTLVNAAWHTDKINAPMAWAITNGSGISIAIVEVPGSSHETIVRNTAQSVAPGANVFTSGINSKNLIKGISSAVRSAADRGARVINVSYVPTNARDAVSATNYARSKGSIVFWSGGNFGTELSFSDTPIVNVSPTDSNDGYPSWASYGSAIDISAPGVNVLGYSGGSISSPVAAGVAALVLSANPDLNPAQVESILESTSIDLGIAGKDSHYGYGRVDAYAAVLKALATTGEPLPPVSPPKGHGKPNKGKGRKK